MKSARQRAAWASKVRDVNEFLDQFTLADIALGPRVDMFPAVGIADLYQRFPRIGAFMARMKARPSWEKSAVRPEPGETEREIAAKAA